MSRRDSSGPFSREEVVSMRVEKFRQFDGTSNSLSCFLILPDFIFGFFNLGGQFLEGFLPRFRHGWLRLIASKHEKGQPILRLPFQVIISMKEAEQIQKRVYGILRQKQREHQLRRAQDMEQ